MFGNEDTLLFFLLLRTDELCVFCWCLLSLVVGWNRIFEYSVQHHSIKLMLYWSIERIIDNITYCIFEHSISTFDMFSNWLWFMVNELRRKDYIILLMIVIPYCDWGNQFDMFLIAMIGGTCRVFYSCWSQSLFPVKSLG